MKKIVICKTCGAEIAKTASRCPKCGARQHQLVLSICAIIVVLTVAACAAVLLHSTGGEPQSQSGGSSPSTSNPSLICETASTRASFVRAFEDASIDGGFYLALDIENLSGKKVMYSLTNTTLDGETVNTGSGVPVVAQPGGSVSAAFIIFTDKSLSDVTSITFSVSARDADALSELDVGGPITIEL